MKHYYYYYKQFEGLNRYLLVVKLNEDKIEGNDALTNKKSKDTYPNIIKRVDWIYIFF